MIDVGFSPFRTIQYRLLWIINSTLATRANLVEGLAVEQGKWIACRNIRNYSELIRGSLDSDLKRTVNRLLREEKKKLVPNVVGHREFVTLE